LKGLPPREWRGDSPDADADADGAFGFGFMSSATVGEGYSLATLT
jgi:hypothetical protein